MKNNKIFGILVVSTIILLMIVLASIKVNDEELKVVKSEEGFELLATQTFIKEEVISRGYPSMLDVGGGDCIPCKAMKPVLDELNEELQGKAIIMFVDYWKYPELASQFEFKLIPTQFFYDNKGKLFTTHEGEITKVEVLNIFKEMGYKFND